MCWLSEGVTMKRCMARTVKSVATPKMSCQLTNSRVNDEITHSQTLSLTEGEINGYYQKKKNCDGLTDTVFIYVAHSHAQFKTPFNLTNCSLLKHQRI